MVAWSRLDLGVGLIATGGVDLLWDGIADLVQVVEVEPQTLWDHAAGDGRSLERRALRWLRSLGRPLLSHGVGFPVGGTLAPELDGVVASARSARELDAVHWSEHLSFNRAGDDAAHAGYLLPPMPTQEVVTAAVSHIRTYQAQLDRPFLVETPTSYLEPVDGDLTDGGFVAAIAEAADCGILLDLHNIWANELNGRQPVADFLDDLPLERVWEVHLAGGFEFGGYHLDAHVGRVPDPLLAIARNVVPRLPHVRAVMFEAVPESIMSLGVPGMRGVLGDLHAVADLPATPEAPKRTAPRPARPGMPAPGLTATAAEREARLVAYTTRTSEESSAPYPGAEVLRFLTDEARLSLLVDQHSDELATLLQIHGRAGTDALLDQFLTETGASSWPADQNAAFSSWLRSHAGLLQP